MAKVIGLSQSFNATRKKKKEKNPKTPGYSPHPTTALEPTKRMASQKMILL
jgi:hypothetical protein